MDITHDNVFFLYAFHFFQTTLFIVRPISSLLIALMDSDGRVIWPYSLIMKIKENKLVP